jgi:hypothetical protein
VSAAVLAMVESTSSEASQLNERIGKSKVALPSAPLKKFGTTYIVTHRIADYPSELQRLLDPEKSSSLLKMFSFQGPIVHDDYGSSILIREKQT